MKISIEAEKQIKSWANKHAPTRGSKPTNAYILVEDGDSKPRWAGNGYGYQTRGGRPIYHPSAYSKIGWSNMVYVPSDRHIIVGRKFLSQLEIDIIQVKLSRHRKRFVNRVLAKFVFYYGD